MRDGFKIVDTDSMMEPEDLWERHMEDTNRKHPKWAKHRIGAAYPLSRRVVYREKGKCNGGLLFQGCPESYGSLRPCAEDGFIRRAVWMI